LFRKETTLVCEDFVSLNVYPSDLHSIFVRVSVSNQSSEHSISTVLSNRLGVATQREMGEQQRATYRAMHQAILAKFVAHSLN
jgi:hypothetical protein